MVVQLAIASMYLKLNGMS